MGDGTDQPALAVEVDNRKNVGVAGINDEIADFNWLDVNDGVREGAKELDQSKFVRGQG